MATRNKRPREDEEEYMVDGILDVNETGDGPTYLIQWADGSTTWEPKKHLEGSQNLLEDFVSVSEDNLWYQYH